MTDMTPAQRIALPLLDRDEAFSLAHRWVRPPDIRLEETRICYEELNDGAIWVKNPGMKLLADFAALGTAPPEAFLKFARRWGVLGLCQHQADGSPPLVMGHEWHPRLGTEGCRQSRAGPLEYWRHYARVLRHLLDTGASLRERHGLRPRSKRADEKVRLFLRDCAWVTRYFGCLRPVLVVEDFRFEVKLCGSFLATGLPAALTSQLLYTVASSVGLATCAGCGELFPPRRRPPPGQRAYCTKCGIRVAWREAQQRRREKAREGK